MTTLTLSFPNPPDGYGNVEVIMQRLLFTGDPYCVAVLKVEEYDSNGKLYPDGGRFVWKEQEMDEIMVGEIITSRI